MTKTTDQDSLIYVPISTELYEFIANRYGVYVGSVVEDLAWTFLEQAELEQDATEHLCVILDFGHFLKINHLNHPSP